PQFPFEGLPPWVSSQRMFHYALSTFRVGAAECQCVPPFIPHYVTLAYMPATTCRSISLTVLAPWIDNSLGGRRPSPDDVAKAGADRVFLMEGDRVIATATVDGHAPLAKLAAPLTGGAWEIRVSELAPASNGNQATVFIDGTLSCATATGT